jgi:hypothetical protein
VLDSSIQNIDHGWSGGVLRTGTDDSDTGGKRTPTLRAFASER